MPRMRMVTLQPIHNVKRKCLENFIFNFFVPNRFSHSLFKGTAWRTHMYVFLQISRCPDSPVSPTPWNKSLQNRLHSPQFFNVQFFKERPVFPNLHKPVPKYKYNHINCITYLIGNIILTLKGTLACGFKLSFFHELTAPDPSFTPRNIFNFCRNFFGIFANFYSLSAYHDRGKWAFSRVCYMEIYICTKIWWVEFYVRKEFLVIFL